MNISSTQPVEERISDFGLIASVVTCNFPILRTEQDGRRIFFVFENSPSLKEAIEGYWDGSLQVPARQYLENTKMLKSRIYSQGAA